MNKTYMIARLTKDIEMRYTQGDRSMAIGKFSVASDRDYKRDGEPTADFYNCIAFGKTAEVLEKYAGTKGAQVALEGRFQNNNWTDKDGNKHYDFQFNVEKVTLIGNRSSVGSQNQNGPVQNQGGPTPASSGDGFMNIPDGIDEKLPFN